MARGRKEDGGVDAHPIAHDADALQELEAVRPTAGATGCKTGYSDYLGAVDSIPRPIQHLAVSKRSQHLAAGQQLAAPGQHLAAIQHLARLQLPGGSWRG